VVSPTKFVEYIAPNVQSEHGPKNCPWGHHPDFCLKFRCFLLVPYSRRTRFKVPATVDSAVSEALAQHMRGTTLVLSDDQLPLFYHSLDVEKAYANPAITKLKLPPSRSYLLLG